MHSSYCSSTRFIHCLECPVPFQSCCCGTSNRVLTRNTACRALTGEVGSKEGTIVVLLLGSGGMNRVPLCRQGKLFITDQRAGKLFQGIDPVVAYPVTELLLLPPDNLIRQILLERLTEK